MAFYETRTVQVANDPSVIDKVTNEAALFMWQVQSQQVTDRLDTHTEYSSDAAYIYETVVTNSANYCTITLTRDKTIPHYSEIVELERQLMEYRRTHQSEYDFSIKGAIIFSIIALVVGALVGSFVSGAIAWVIEIGVIVFLVWRIVSEVKSKKSFYQSKETKLANMKPENQILLEARQLNSQVIQEMR